MDAAVPVIGGDPWVAVSSAPLPDPAPNWPAPLGGEFSVASFNTLNFDAGASALKFDKVITTVHTLGGPTFLSLEEIDVELGLQKVKEGMKLIKASRQRLKEIENEFEEIKKEIAEEK